MHFLGYRIVGDLASVRRPDCGVRYRPIPWVDQNALRVEIRRGDDADFFLSHARQDRETPGKFLMRFFEDLELLVAQYSGISLKEQRLATIDTRLQHGDDWDENLSRSLSNDSVLVAILTPVYFNRPNCGRKSESF